MKKRFLFVLACFCTLMGAQIHAADVNEKPFVVPEITAWKGAAGQFAYTSSSRVVYAAKAGAKAASVAKSFCKDYQTIVTPITGGPSNRPAISEGGTAKAKAGDFSFALTSDKKLGDEGYRIKIGDRVEVTARTSKGLYWATRTLLQMMEQATDNTLPKGEITDVPTYRVRGFMIDCGRKFIPLDYLKSLVKIMAYYKMNTLQVHLNDNGFPGFYDNDWSKTYAAFRMECSTYPGLTAKDGSYGKDEFRQFQKDAASIGVDIIPEIDVPAHSLAFTQYWPNLASKDCDFDHLDIFKDSTYMFLDGLFKEYLEGSDPVFVGKRVHIGTDEYSNKRPELREKFRYFTDYYIKEVEKYGKQAVVWGSLSHAYGDTPVKVKNVVMNLWSNDYAKPLDMKKLGYQCISIPDGYTYIVPAAGYYYDYLNAQYLYEHWTPKNVGGKVTFPEGDPQLEGGLFAVWNDHVGNGISVKDIHHRIFDVLPTMATKCWTAARTSLPYDQFSKNSSLLSEAPGVNEDAHWGHQNGTILKKAVVEPGSTNSYPEIGYDYVVKFRIDGHAEALGTELFRSPSAVFWLSDPISGMLGFSRDGYLYKFRYSVKEGETANIRVEGDSRATRLYVNDRLVDDLTPIMTSYGKGKKTLYYQQTLVFPLQKAGNFNSKVTNLEVERVK